MRPVLIAWANKRLNSGLITTVIFVNLCITDCMYVFNGKERAGYPTEEEDDDDEGEETQNIHFKEWYSFNLSN